MNLFPKHKRPYYIYAPSYTHKSSGVRTLHLLCHALNEVGYTAQMVQHLSGNGYGHEPFYVNSDLNTPIAVSGQFIDPIVIYPDIVRGNPLGLKSVVRYLLAPSGAYGGDRIFPDTDNIWGALPSIAQKVLRIPVSDPRIFNYIGEKRSGSCFYSHKYEMHGNVLLDITKDSIHLEGSLDDIANTLRRSEVCYLYEVSSILTEAALCGCKVVLVRTPYLNKIDPSCMMGNTEWSDGEIVKECEYYAREYQEILDGFPLNLNAFIKDTQGMP